jgi:hypothetical protein
MEDSLNKINPLEVNNKPVEIKNTKSGTLCLIVFFQYTQDGDEWILHVLIWWCVQPRIQSHASHWQARGDFFAIITKIDTDVRALSQKVWTISSIFHAVTGNLRGNSSYRVELFTYRYLFSCNNRKHFTFFMSELKKHKCVLKTTDSGANSRPLSQWGIIEDVIKNVFFSRNS